MRKKATNKQKAYIYEYQKENTRRINFQLNKIHDADILEFLDSLENKNLYLKNLVRDDMKKKKAE